MSDDTISLGPGREFDAIRGFLRGGRLPGRVRIGPGDDGCVLEGGWVLSTDLMVEDVHFRRVWLSDREIGYRAAAAALSDLAAMSASAVGLLVSVASPRTGVDLQALQAGVQEAADAAGAAVLGGDLSRSPGPLFIDVAVVGTSHSPTLRNGALPGDEVWVTGSLGAAAAAVRVWESGEEPADSLRRAFARPPFRTREAGGLAEEERVHALIDLSDGLVGDVGHVAAGSGVRIVLEPPQVPLVPAAVSALGFEEARRLALHGGEDYELCFAAPPGVVNPGRFEAHFGVTLTRVGRVEEGEGVWLDDGDGEPVRAERGGFDHLGGEGAG
ncbi:MAG: thiamine-phosphate kinase [Longimicrobiales bacterium]